MSQVSEIDYSFVRPATDGLRPEQLLAADQKSVSNVVFMSDVVEISPIGRKCAMCADHDTAQSVETSEKPPAARPPLLMETSLPEGAFIQTLGSMTLDSGRTVTIEKFTLPAAETTSQQIADSSRESPSAQDSGRAADPADTDTLANPDTVSAGSPEPPAFGYRAVIHAADGQSAQAYLLQSDTIIHEDDNGVLQLTGYTAGAETSGDDLIVGFQGNVLNGGSGNDTIIDMSADYHAHAGRVATSATDTASEMEQSAAASIDSGSGDDTVILVGQRILSVSVTTGSGNDTVISTGDIEISQIDTGSGDDTIKIHGNLSIRGAIISDGAFTGTESPLGPVFRTGSGSDTVEVDGDLDIRGGSMTSSAASPGATPAEDVYPGIDVSDLSSRKVDLVSIETGSGDDTIRVAGSLHMDSGVIRTGDGDDAILVGGNLTMDSDYNHVGRDSIASSIETEDGDDRIVAGGDVHLDDSEITTGAGDDTLTARNIRARDDSVISTGDGDDTIAAGRELSLKYRSAIISGNGDDTIHAGSMLHMYWEALMNTGNGDDTISSGKNMTIDVYSLVKTGDGNDTMKAANRLHVDGDSIVHTGEGNDRIRGGRKFSTDGNAMVYTSGGDDSISAGRRMHSDGNSGIHTGAGNDSILAGYGSTKISGLGVHGGSMILTGDGDDTITATNLIVSGGSSIRTGSGNDHIRAYEMYVSGTVDTGAGDDTIEAQKIILWGNSGTGLRHIPYSMFQFPEIAGGQFRGINAYQKIMMSGNFDPEELTTTRQEYLEALLRGHGYDGDLE